MVFFILTKAYGIDGVILGLLISLLITFLLSISKFHKKIKSIKLYLNGHKKEDWFVLFKYSVMLLSSVLAFPLVEMYIRNEITTQAGLTAAGQWQAILRLSSAYLVMISVILSFLMIPRLTISKNNKSLIRVLLIGFGVVFFIISTAYYLINNFWSIVISIALSSDFLFLKDLFSNQMISDLLRTFGWVIGFILIAKSYTILYVIFEIVQAGVFMYIFNIYFSPADPLNSTIGAYFISNSIYLLVCFIFLLSYLFVKRRS